MSNAPRVVGGIVILGIAAYIFYRIYQSGYSKGVHVTTQKYEQKLQVKENRIQELLSLVDQLQKELAKLKKLKE